MGLVNRRVFLVAAYFLAAFMLAASFYLYVKLVSNDSFPEEDDSSFQAWSASSANEVDTFYGLANTESDTDWNATSVKFSRLRSGKIIVFGILNGTITLRPPKEAVVSICHAFPNRSFTQALQCEQAANSDQFEVNTTSHIVFESTSPEDNRVYVFVRLYLMSPESNGAYQYYFCYGLPFANFDSELRTANCPPCICPAVFEGVTLVNENLALTDLEIESAVSFAQLDPGTVSKVNKASLYHKHSRFVSCLTLRPGEPKNYFLDGQSDRYPWYIPWAVREYYRKNGMRVGLDSGTLLGWYRNCSLIADDADLDLMLPNWEFNETFYNNLLHRVHDDAKPLRTSISLSQTEERLYLKSTRIFGDMKAGVEVRFDISKKNALPAGVDVFVLHVNDEYVASVGWPHTMSFVTWERLIIYYELPKNLTVCSTIFLRHLYLVPCEPEGVVSAWYGKTWKDPSYGKSAAWNILPNIQKKLFFTPNEWRRRRMYAGFE